MNALVEQFIIEQREYAFGKARRLKEIEAFCTNFSYGSVVEAMPLDWHPWGHQVNLSVREVIHAWLEERITKV